MNQSRDGGLPQRSAGTSGGSDRRPMALFIDTFVNKIDSKGRVSVPATFRVALGSQSFPGIVALPLHKYRAVRCAGNEDPCHPRNLSRSPYSDVAAYPLRAGTTIAATPTITQTSPIKVVGASVSPRKTVPMATPIGTRR